MLCSAGCGAQTTKHVNTNRMLCDTATGLCEMPGTATADTNLKIAAAAKPVKLIYFTDPICSSCWGIEPQLRRLKLEYGADVEVEYHMGGLLPDWSYNSGGISKPSDVASHWDEASHHYQMPIDGDVWLEDPLHSSYPPSIAFKAAQLQDQAKAVVFLRALREMVFMKKKNITKWPVIEAAADEAGLDKAQLRRDFEGNAKTMFEEDLQLARNMGVRGFPSVFIAGADDKSVFVYGSRPYSEYEAGIRAVYAKAEKMPFASDWKSLFTHYPTLATQEFAVMSGTSFDAAGKELGQLLKDGRIRQLKSKNGPLWSLQ